VIDYRRFTADLTKATRLAFSELRSLRPDETVSVFGYVTDDDVVVLTPVANTREEHRRMVERGVYSDADQVDALMIEEWPLYGIGNQYFQEVSQVVNQYVHGSPRRRGPESFADRKVNLLKSFGHALQSLRAENDTTFLGIFNPDPGLEELALYYCVAQLINPPGEMLDLCKEYVEQTIEANGSTLDEISRQLKSKGMLIREL
jgi:hypothetical protein